MRTGIFIIHTFIVHFFFNVKFNLYKKTIVFIQFVNKWLILKIGGYLRRYRYMKIFTS